MAKGVMLAAAGVCFALPLRAQITSYVDESGKRIYINAIPPPSRLAANVPRKQQPGPLPGVRAAGSATVLRVLPTVSASKGQLERMVSESSARHGVDPQLVRAVIEAESGWNPIAV